MNLKIFAFSSSMKVVYNMRGIWDKKCKGTDNGFGTVGVSEGAFFVPSPGSLYFIV